MTRSLKHTLHRSLPFAAALLLGASATVGSLQQGGAMQAKPAQGKVQWIEGTMGGNIGVLTGEEGALVVDTYIAGGREPLVAAVTAAAEKGVRLVLNTHWHGDHTGNNAVWGDTATVLAHENVRVRLVAGGRNGEPADPATLPLVTYQDGVALHVAGEDVRVRHFANAHTDGDSVVWFETSKVLHTGDLFFRDRFPFVDLSSGGSVTGLIAAVRELLVGLDESWVVIPGHGPLAKKEDLSRYLAMLEETSGLVKEALEAGRTLDQMKEEGILAPWKDWSWQFVDSDRFLTTLVESLR
jgi:glyoxylase-like metal-dependent hydrolase (beta-lactamase superfamily II)